MFQCPTSYSAEKIRKEGTRWLIGALSSPFSWIWSTRIFLPPSSAGIHMDAPVASKIIVSFHPHSDGPYFWPHACSKRKVPSSVSEQHPKREITPMVHLMSTFSLTDTKRVFKMHKLFISGKFKQARTYVFSLFLSLCIVFIQGLSLNLVRDRGVQELDPLVPLA